MEKRFKGITIRKYNKYILKKEKIIHLMELETNTFIIPDFQRLLNNDKIQDMLNEDEEIFNFMTNPLQFAHLENNDISIYYLIDGQHRYEMYKQKFEKTKINYDIFINIIECTNLDDILKLYNKINYDNINIIKFDDISKYAINKRYINFRNKLNNNMNEYFKLLKDIYSLEEFTLHLKFKNYLDNFDNIDNAIDYLKDCNDIYYNLYYKNKDYSKYKKKEQEFILNHYIISLKNNNFLDFLFTSPFDRHNFIFYHSK
jgi:hypothetical protein